MIETQAIVVAVEPGYAWVESERRSACSHCESGSSCGVSSLGKLFGVKRNRMRLGDPIGVHAGDAVVIGLSEQRLLRAAALAYMLPLLVMLAIAVLSAQLGYSQAMTVVASLLGLAGGLWLARQRSRRTAAGDLYNAVLLRRTVVAKLDIVFEPMKRSHP